LVNISILVDKDIVYFVFWLIKTLFILYFG